MKKNLLNISQEKLMDYALKFYKISMGKKCDIYHPVLFTEKVLWYSFFYNNPKCSYIVDKVTFKQYINDILGDGYTIPMFGFWKTIEEFEKAWFSSALPNEFCLKANLQSDGRNIIIIHDKSSSNFEEIRKEVKEWLKPENTLMNSFARYFYLSEPKILAEKYLSNYKNQLYDYKLFCFDGKPYCMYVATEHFMKDDYPITFYDLDWNKLDVQYGHHQNADVPKPVHYEEMKELAKILSKGFPFLRVDFFDTKEKLYLAELTFNPGGGFVPYCPESFNRKLGDLFILPSSFNDKI